jgi:hypothetical protein
MTEGEVEQESRGGCLRTTLGLVLVVIGLGVLLALTWTLFRSIDTVSESFDGQVDRVVIETDGQVDVEVGDVVEVAARREWVFGASPVVEMTLEGGVLRISSGCPGFNILCHASIRATVPESAEIFVQTSAGSVTVVGTTSGVDLSTDAGDVTVDVSGSAVLATSAGSITGTIRDGEVDATTSAGSIELSLEGEFLGVSAVTSAGDVELTVPDEIYAVDADTSAGDVTIEVRTDPESDLEIRARSSAGDVTITNG